MANLMKGKNCLMRIKFKMLAAFTLLAVLFSSCDNFHEHLQPCDQGLKLRFVYDYNMEFANAFPSQVDCLKVFFYDKDGRPVAVREAFRPDLQDENWRMTVDLPAGDYTLLAYGGMNCDDSSFSFVKNPADISLTETEVRLKPEMLATPSDLHPLFYGTLTATVDEDATAYNEATVYMMKDTHTLRVLLQQTEGEYIDESLFTFNVVADNTLFAYNNDIIPQGNVTYLPWDKGNASAGELPDETDARVVYAEFTFPRLVTSSSPRLVIKRAADGNTVIDIPLINYLLLLKSAKYASMENQEYLDRESGWNMIFFLDRNYSWISTTIVINDWVVRINNPEL